MSAFVRGFAAVVGRQRQEAKQQLTNIEKTGLKMTLDVRNSALTEMEMDVLDIMDDPMNSADFKLRALNRLIVVNLKYVALVDNPKIGALLSAWHNAMANWNILIEDYSSFTQSYAIVEREYVHVYEDGTVQVRSIKEALSPADFQHQFFQYQSESDWQTQMKKRYWKTEEELKKYKPLTFTPVKESVKTEMTGLGEDEQEEIRSILADNEYFARVEMIPRGWKVYGWMHREKHTFPNTPIVISGGGAQPDPRALFAATGSLGGGAATPPAQPMGRTSTS